MRRRAQLLSTSLIPSTSCEPRTLSLTLGCGVMRRFPHMFQRASLCLGSAVEAEAGEFHRRVAVRVAEDGAEDLRGPRLVVPRRPERVELGRLPRRRQRPPKSPHTAANFSSALAWLALALTLASRATASPTSAARERGPSSASAKAGLGAATEKGHRSAVSPPCS